MLKIRTVNKRNTEGRFRGPNMYILGVVKEEKILDISEAISF